MSKNKKRHHKITNAYEAWWFIYSHPAFMLQERHEVTPEEADKLKAEGYLISKDVGGKCYKMCRHLHRHALDVNLSIFYTKTNKPGGHGTVDDDGSKNKFVEVWLEFGPLGYGYAYSGGEKPMADWDTETTMHHYHDVDLDTGGTTFDDGLVRLARNVRKHYGDYKEKTSADQRRSECGKPECADCKAIGRMMKGLGLKEKKQK
jgi:hypothetical protein